MVEPTGTSIPARRSTRVNATAMRSTSARPARAASGTARDRLAYQRPEPVLAGAFLVLAALEDRAERRFDCPFVEAGGAERREGLRPVERLGNARRFVEVEPAQGLDRGRDVARERRRHLGRPDSQDREL